MTHHPPRSTLTATLFPFTTLFRSQESVYPFLTVDDFDNDRQIARQAQDLRRMQAARPPVAHRTTQHGCPRQMHLAGLQDNSLVERLAVVRSEEHTSELQSLMRISYAVFCLKKKI